MPEKAPFSESELRGTLINKSKLRGTLIDKEADRPKKFEEQTFIQRDGGQEYTVKIVQPEKDRITLVETSGGSTVTLSLSDFKRKLETEGSPWSIK